MRSFTGTGGVYTINNKPLTKPCTTLAEAVTHLTTGALGQARHPDIRIRPTGQPVQLNQASNSHIITPLSFFETGANYLDLRCVFHPSTVDHCVLCAVFKTRLESRRKGVTPIVCNAWCCRRSPVSHVPAKAPCSTGSATTSPPTCSNACWHHSIHLCFTLPSTLRFLPWHASTCSSTKCSRVSRVVVQARCLKGSMASRPTCNTSGVAGGLRSIASRWMLTFDRRLNFDKDRARRVEENIPHLKPWFEHSASACRRAIFSGTTLDDLDLGSRAHNRFRAESRRELDPRFDLFSSTFHLICSSAGWQIR